jgi:hypothetical protein
MSDFSSDPSQPPAPPAPAGFSPAPPPMGAYPPAPGMMTMEKPPRPVVTVGAALMVAGGALLILGSFLNWFTIEGEAFTGFSGEDGDTKDGPVFVFFGVVAAGLGVAMLAAKRMLAVAIIGVVFSVLAMLAAFVDLGDVSDAKDLAGAFGIEFSQGPGLWIILLGSLLALAGSIAALAKRRR